MNYKGKKKITKSKEHYVYKMNDEYTHHYKV